MSAVLKPYTPRPGSVAERAIEYLTAFGERSATDLADAIEVETATLIPCLSTAIRFGAVEQFKRGGRIWYRLGDGTPPAPATDERLNTPPRPARAAKAGNAVAPRVEGGATTPNDGGAPLGNDDETLVGGFAPKFVPAAPAERRMTLSLEVTMHEAEMIFSVLRCAGRTA